MSRGVPIGAMTRVPVQGVPPSCLAHSAREARHRDKVLHRYASEHRDSLSETLTGVPRCIRRQKPPREEPM